MPMPMPDVFIVPADFVAKNMSEAFPKNARDGRTTWCSIYGKPPKPPMYFFHIEADENHKEMRIAKRRKRMAGSMALD